MTGQIKTNAFSQWNALSGRAFRNTISSGELITTIIVAGVFTAGLYLPMKFVMSTVQGIDYGQYVVPVIALQTMATGMAASAAGAAVEARDNFTMRLKAMPVPPTAILVSRLTNALVRGVIALAAVIGFGHLIGFRLNAGLTQSILFCTFVVSIGVVLALTASALGTLTANPQAMSQITMIPSIVLGLTSTGFVPESGFPEWIRPFARNQPVSQWSQTLRDMATTGATWDSALPAILWVAGLFVIAAPLAVWSLGRRE